MVQTVAPPPAAAMVPAEPLQQWSLEREPTPEEVVELVAENYGLYHDVAARLNTLQEWARNILK